MFEREVVVNNAVGLHARAATYFVQRANEFKSNISIRKEEKTCNAKSLLGTLSLGIMPGTRINITADGKDEKVAVNALAELVLSNFEEKE